MSTLTEEKLEFWIEKGYNALFVGLHGVGKTARVRKAFNAKFGKQGVDWLYFSAATMDPWVDFIGVPKEFTDEEKKLTYLKLIRPYCIELGLVKAMFFDELNRAHKKVRNAVMELIQFHSVNGLEMPNLKCIWGAINPENDDKVSYDVEVLDPAQKDRFHVFVDIPYKPDLAYLKGEYGDTLAVAANDWWNSIPSEEIRLKVSPRRLDYALQMFRDGGDIRDVLPKESQVPKLVDALMNGSPARVFEGLVRNVEKGQAGAQEALKEFLRKDNNYRIVEEKIIKQAKARSASLPLLSPEQVATLLANHKTVKDEVFTNNPKQYEELIKEIAVNGQNKRLKTEARKAMQTLGADTTDKVDLPTRECKLPVWQKDSILGGFEPNANCAIFKKQAPMVADWKKELLGVQQQCTFSDNLYQRKKAMEKIVPLIHDNMDAEESTMMIKFIEWFVSNSEYSKLDAMADIHEIINTPMVCYIKAHMGAAEGENVGIAELFKLAPHTVGKYLFPKLMTPSNKEWFINLKPGAKIATPNKATAEEVTVGV